MKHIKLFESFLNESKVDAAIEKIKALPHGKMLDDAKNIESVFKKSKHTWSEVIEAFENEAKEVQIAIKDIQITQPNIQMSKVEKMLNASNLPLINVVKFNDGYAIYDGHHRLMSSWAVNDKKIKVNLVTI